MLTIWRALHSCPRVPSYTLVHPPLNSAYAKLGMISSALSSDSDDVTKLLNVSLDLITKTKNLSTKPDNPHKGSKPGLALASAGGSLKGTVKGGSAIADNERAVEVLSFLVSKTKVWHVLFVLLCSSYHTE